MKKAFTFALAMLLGAGLAFAQTGGDKDKKTNTTKADTTRALNPQPLPPGDKRELNPQPLPPGDKAMVGKNQVNPQPLPPGKQKTVQDSSGKKAHKGGKKSKKGSTETSTAAPPK